MPVKTQQVEYKGFRLVQVSAARVEIYNGARHVTWGISLAQAKRIVDDVILLQERAA